MKENVFLIYMYVHRFRLVYYRESDGRLKSEKNSNRCIRRFWTVVDWAEIWTKKKQTLTLDQVLGFCAVILQKKKKIVK